MTTTPDPLDVLKYAFVLTWNLTQNHEDLDPLREHLQALVDPFLGEGFDLDDLRYSDGRPVSLLVRLDLPVGATMQQHQLPPGYPASPHAA